MFQSFTKSLGLFQFKNLLLYFGVNKTNRIMKNNKIIYDVKIIKQIYDEDFRKLTNHYLDSEMRQISFFRQTSGIFIVEDFIQYAEGTNNWCPGDLEYFERQLLKSNARFQEFRDFLFAQGYRGFSEIEIGTLWITTLAMFDELLNMGFADLDRSAAANSFAVAVMEYEKKQKIKAKKKGVIVDFGKSGRKQNVFNDSYMMWIQRLLPWLRKHEAIGNQKDALIFIGFLLEASGHFEFKQQYERDSRVTKIVRKVKGKSRWQEFETKVEYVPVPYREYLHNRMKAIMYRIKDRAA